jgi:hypothetical protein
VIRSLRNWWRGLLHLRQDRALPRRSSKPSIGATIIAGDLRITIQAGLSDELWVWLLDEGWRELTYRPDRRHYREIPSSWVTRLIDAEPETRPLVMDAAVAKASLRPTLGDPNVLPSYVVRG